MEKHCLTRRGAIGVVAGALAWVPAARAGEPVKALVHRSPSCGCCGKWVERLRAAGYAVDMVNEADMKAVKTRLGVPEDLASCHTAEIGGYVVEGHTPLAAIDRLLREKPKAVGLAVPGMPAGSPGMEMGDEKEVYEVVLFDAGGRRSYGRFEGARAL